VHIRKRLPTTFGKRLRVAGHFFCCILQIFSYSNLICQLRNIDLSSGAKINVAKPRGELTRATEKKTSKCTLLFTSKGRKKFISNPMVVALKVG